MVFDDLISRGGADHCVDGSTPTLFDILGLGTRSDPTAFNVIGFEPDGSNTMTICYSLDIVVIDDGSTPT